VVVFVTAYDEYALRAFEVHAVAYLLKPFDRERFHQAMGRAKTQIRSAHAQELLARMQGLLNDLDKGSKGSSSARGLERMVIKSGGRTFFLSTSEIDWIETEGNYVRLHVGSESYRLRETLATLEEKLNSQRFARIHRRYLVNLDRMQELQPWFHGDFVVILKDGTELRLSRRYKSRLEEKLGGRL
jgi:two-component system LytT family response regulator